MPSSITKTAYLIAIPAFFASKAGLRFLRFEQGIYMKYNKPFFVCVFSNEETNEKRRRDSVAFYKNFSHYFA